MQLLEKVHWHRLASSSMAVAWQPLVQASLAQPVPACCPRRRHLQELPPPLVGLLLLLLLLPPYRHRCRLVLLQHALGRAGTSSGAPPHPQS
jgi:hypothetical protein